MIFVDLFKAMAAGKEVADPAKWKIRQNNANNLVVVITFLVSLLRLLGVDLPITDEELVAVAAALAMLMGVFNSVMTAITTKKISITNKTTEEKK